MLYQTAHYLVLGVATQVLKCGYCRGRKPWSEITHDLQYRNSGNYIRLQER